MIFEICAAISTLLFAILVFFLVQTLKGLQKSLQRVDSLTETKIDPIMDEAIALTHSLNEKISAFDALFESVRKLGFYLHQSINASHVRFTVCPEEKKPPWHEKMAHLIQLATLGIETWQKLKKRR